MIPITADNRRLWSRFWFAAFAVALMAVAALPDAARAETEDEVIERAKPPKSRFPGNRFAPAFGVSVFPLSASNGFSSIKVGGYVGVQYWVIDRLALSLDLAFQPSNPAWLTPALNLQWVFFETDARSAWGFAPYLSGGYGYAIALTDTWTDAGVPFGSWHELKAGLGFYIFAGPVGLKLGGGYGARLGSNVAGSGESAQGFWIIDPGLFFSF
jgi:hypothetical protein